MVRDIKGANGFIAARVDSSGNITLGSDPGPIVGRVTNAGEVFDDEAGAHQIGRVDGDGQIFNMEYELLGKVDPWGRVYEPSGSLVGQVEKSVDAGALLLFIEPTQPMQAPAASPDQEATLMNEALELSQEHSFPKIRKDYKPLTDRDLFMEHLRRDSDS